MLSMLQSVSADDSHNSCLCFSESFNISALHSVSVILSSINQEYRLWNAEIMWSSGYILQSISDCWGLLDFEEIAFCINEFHSTDRNN